MHYIRNHLRKYCFPQGWKVVFDWFIGRFYLYDEKDAFLCPLILPIQIRKRCLLMSTYPDTTCPLGMTTQFSLATITFTEQRRLLTAPLHFSAAMQPQRDTWIEIHFGLVKQIVKFDKHMFVSKADSYVVQACLILKKASSWFVSSRTS